jgi:hypothetical protein
MSSSQHVYEIRRRKDRRGIDLIGERLPLGMLWFEGYDVIEDAVSYARSFSYPNPAIIRVLDESGMLVVSLELANDFSRAVNISAPPLRFRLMSSSKSIGRSKEQEATLARPQKQIEALTAALQKVSAQLELNNSVPQTVQCNGRPISARN